MFRKIILLIIFVLIPLRAFAGALSEKDTFMAAKNAYDEGSYNLSYDLFNRFISQFPSSKALLEAKLYTGQCLFQNGKFSEACDIFTKLEKEYVPYGIEDRLLFWLGQAYLKAKDLNQAAVYFDKLIKMYPNSNLLYSAKMQRGWIYLQEGELDEAKSAFDTLDALTVPQGTVVQEEALFRKGELQFQTKNYKGSLDAFKNFVRLFANSEQIANVYFYLAESSFYLDDFQSAINYYSKALEKSEDDLVKAECLQGLGWSYLNENKLPEAEEAFSKIDSLMKDDFNKQSLFLGKATLYYKLSKFEEALSYYDKLIGINPKRDIFIQALLGKAECLNKLSRFSESIDLYKEAIALSSAQDTKQEKELFLRAHYNLGLAYFETDNFDTGLQELNQAVALSDNNETSLSILYRIAETYQDTQEFDRAIEIYNRILKEYPANSYNDYVVYQLGITQLKSNQIESAIATFKRFNGEFSHSEFIDDANYYLCYAYYIGNKLEMASHQLSRFLEAFPDSIYRDKANYLLAVSFYNRGMFSEALNNFEKIQREAKRDQDLAEKAEYESAHILYQMGDEQAAINRFRQFINSHPKSEIAPGVIFWLGQYFRDKKDFEASRRNFETLVRMYPNYSLTEDAKYEIGLTFLAEEKMVEALHMFQRILDVTEQPELKAKTMLIIGDLLLQESRNNEAINVYKGLTQLISSNNIGIEVSRASLQQKDINSKIIEYREDIYEVNKGTSSSKEIVPKEDESLRRFVKLAYFRLGDTYKQEKIFTEAISSYDEALKFPVDEINAQIQFNIAECLEQDNNLDAALEKYASITENFEQDRTWIVKGLLRSARIYENRADWLAVKKTYEKIVSYSVPESKYAQEKLEQIKK